MGDREPVGAGRNGETPPRPAGESAIAGGPANDRSARSAGGATADDGGGPTARAGLAAEGDPRADAGTAFDVVVVGLGAMGAAVLHQLARRGVRALGIERFSSPHAMGSSHGQTRITRRATGEGEVYAPFVDASHAIWRALETRTGETLFVERGVLLIAPGDGSSSTHGRPDFLARTIDVARSNGIGHELLDARAVRERFPVFAGVRDGDVGYFEPRAGYVYPERCIAAQLRLACEDGATLWSETPVTALRGTGAGAGAGVEIDTPSGTVRAGRAIVSAGAWTAPLLGAPFDALLTVRRQALHWFGTDGGAGEAGAFERMPAFVWLHGRSDDDVFYGFPPVLGESSVKVAEEQYSSATTADALERLVTPSEARTMHARHVAGRLAGVSARTSASAACTYTMTPDHGFVIDAHPECSRITVIAACSGHGFKHSAGIGRAVAETVVDGCSFAGLEPFSLSRFR